jgi:hypothetical protein
VPVAGDVGHQLTCTVTVTYALLRTTTSATSAAVTVIPQASGPAGATGQNGPGGPSGATGPQGPPGELELVTCKSVKTTITRKHKRVHVTKQTCTTKLVSGPVKFTRASADLRASLSRAGAIYATGYARRTHAGLQTSLLAARRLARGRYTLTLTTRYGQRHTSTRQQVAIR